MQKWCGLLQIAAMACGRLLSWHLSLAWEPCRRCYSPRYWALIDKPPSPVADAMTSEQAAQLIDDTLDLVHQRLQELQAQALPREQHALAEEFREWRHPVGGHIDLMVFPGLANS